MLHSLEIAGASSEECFRFLIRRSTIMKGKLWIYVVSQPPTTPMEFQLCRRTRHKLSSSSSASTAESTIHIPVPATPRLSVSLSVCVGCWVRDEGGGYAKLSILEGVANEMLNSWSCAVSCKQHIQTGGDLHCPGIRHSNMADKALFMRRIGSHAEDRASRYEYKHGILYFSIPTWLIRIDIVLLHSSHDALAAWRRGMWTLN